jgi:hypothetical protein
MLEFWVESEANSSGILISPVSNIPAFPFPSPSITQCCVVLETNICHEYRYASLNDGDRRFANVYEYLHKSG